MRYLILGLTLGLSAGMSPGPLLTLVITTALRRGWIGGLLVALAPFITDAPIIVASVFLLDRLPSWAMAVVTVVGGFFVIYLGIDALRAARSAGLPGSEEEQTIQSQRSGLWQGALVNALSPHPYLFWATVGAPTLLAGWRERPAFGLAFLAGFYLLLVGSKVGVARLVATQGHRLSERAYRVILTILGFGLVVLGALLLREAWNGLGWWVI